MNIEDPRVQMKKKYVCGRASKKYWKYLIFFIIDCACTNEYIVFQENAPKEEVHTAGRKRMCIREILSPLIVNDN